MKKQPTLLFIVVVCVFLAACSKKTPQAPTREAQQDAVREEVADILAEAFERDPNLEQTIISSPGYAVFTYRMTKLPLFPTGGIGGGGGFGIVYDSENGDEHFMRVTKAEWGWGMGTKEEAVIIVFHNSWAVRQFLKGRMQYEAGAAADIKAGGVGGGMGSASGKRRGGMTPYVLTKSGVSYGISVRSMRARPDRKLQ